MEGPIRSLAREFMWWRMLYAKSSETIHSIHEMIRLRLVRRFRMAVRSSGVGKCSSARSICSTMLCLTLVMSSKFLQPNFLEAIISSINGILESLKILGEGDNQPLTL